LLAVAAIACPLACGGGTADEPAPTPAPDSTVADPSPSQATTGDDSRVMDANNARVVGLRSPRSPLTPAARKTEGDWSFNVGGQVNSAPALGGAGLAPSCADRLFVSVNAGGTNFYAFDNLHTTDSKGVACANASPVDARCSPSPSGHCPRPIWARSLNGMMDGNSISLSLDGAQVYVATTTGFLYALNAATGATLWTVDTRGISNINDTTFRGVTPWVDYATGTVIVAGWSPGLNTGAIGRISSTGVVQSYVLLPSGVSSTPLLVNGVIYLTARNGLLYKVVNGPTLTMAGNPWPVTLTPNVPIVASPTIDTTANALFVGQGDLLWSVNLTTGAKTSTSISLQANASPCVSSAYVDLPTLSVYVGHEGALWRATYNATGAWTGTPRSAVVRGDDTTTTNDPTSSPLVFSPTPGTTYAYMGDYGGYLNRWTGPTLATRATFPAGATGIGARIESPVMIDYVNGNLYFGANNGRVYQIGQVSLQ
jgi:outer membrane protein assembly factor BamB